MLDEALETALVKRAEREQRPVEEIHADLVAAGLAQTQRDEDLWQRWQALSRREQEVIAFTCLGYTNRQIAGKLGISHETVNWYIRNLLVKLDFHNKYELTMQFKGWDFNKVGPEAQ